MSPGENKLLFDKIMMDFYIVSSLKQQSPDGQFLLLFLNSDVVAAEKQHIPIL